MRKNYQKAFEYHELGADLGDASACYDLADCYYNGRGVEKDLLKVVEVLQSISTTGSQKLLSELLVTAEFKSSLLKKVLI
jgi:TPR repeat protein